MATGASRGTGGAGSAVRGGAAAAGERLGEPLGLFPSSLQKARGGFGAVGCVGRGRAAVTLLPSPRLEREAPAGNEPLPEEALPLGWDKKKSFVLRTAERVNGL